MSVKERILQIVDSQPITKETFFSEIGYSAGNFRGENIKKQVSSDVLVTIVTKFRVNAHWLLTGEGEMYQDYNAVSEQEEVYGDKNNNIKLLQSNLDKAEKLIAILEKENDRLEKENDQLKKNIPKSNREKQPRAGRAS